MQVSNSSTCLIDDLEHYFWIQLLSSNTIIQWSAYKKEIQYYYREMHDIIKIEPLHNSVTRRYSALPWELWVRSINEAAINLTILGWPETCFNKFISYGRKLYLINWNIERKSSSLLLWWCCCTLPCRYQIIFSVHNRCLHYVRHTQFPFLLLIHKEDKIVLYIWICITKEISGS